ncbi:MAG: hypothetical protein FWE34_07510 [Defluviitaleaceae bacterium]|nr:hypothetical protein [Defluviitaleaceae bacterium]
MDNFSDSIRSRLRLVFSVETVCLIAFAWISASFFGGLRGLHFGIFMVVVYIIGELVRKCLVMKNEPNIAIWRIAFLLNMAQRHAVAYINFMVKHGLIENKGTKKNPYWVVK